MELRMLGCSLQGMMDNGTLHNVVLAAKRIMESESRHNFEVYAIDDSEHIPRMARIAHAIRGLLVELGAPRERCDAIADDLLAYARQLYVAEWMCPQPSDENPPLEEEAIQSFNEYLSRKKKRTKP